jgi:hypothetical protein
MSAAYRVERVRFRLQQFCKSTGSGHPEKGVKSEGIHADLKFCDFFIFISCPKFTKLWAHEPQKSGAHNLQPVFHQFITTPSAICYSIAMQFTSPLKSEIISN